MHLRAVALAAACLAVPAIGAAKPAVTPASPELVVEFEVFLPLEHEAELDQLLAAQQDRTSSQYHQWLTPAEFRRRFGAPTQTVQRVREALEARGLTVTDEHAQGLHVTARADGIKQAFGADLVFAQTALGRAHLQASRPLVLPAELAEAHARVAAFAAVVPRHTTLRNLGAISAPANRYGSTGPYWFTDIKQAYDFPSYQALTGRGRTIAIVMASDYLDSDMQSYFGHEGLAPPCIVRVPVLGGAPFSATSDASAEVSLDIQQSGGMAPGATIRLYNIPDLTDNSLLTAYNQIVQTNAADIVSSSLAGPEAVYLPSYNGGVDYTSVLSQSYESIFRQGNAQGITFVASSGDQGGLDVPSPDYFAEPPSTHAHFVPGVDHPASSPSVTAVGGTNLVTTASTTSLESRYVTENAFGDPDVPYDPYGLGVNVSGGYWGSGGGQSQVFARPAYQALVPTHAFTRAVPDVALHEGGCPAGIAQLPCGTPRSSVVAAVGGSFYALIGTSVSAPEFAGLLALAEEGLGGVRLGNVNFLLYEEAAAQAANPSLAYFHDEQPGFNGHEFTGPVYNQVLGVGTPYGVRVILQPHLPPAGTPQTPSNP